MAYFFLFFSLLELLCSMGISVSVFLIASVSVVMLNYVCVFCVPINSSWDLVRFKVSLWGGVCVCLCESFILSFIFYCLSSGDSVVGLMTWFAQKPDDLSSIPAICLAGGKWLWPPHMHCGHTTLHTYTNHYENKR